MTILFLGVFVKYHPINGACPNHEYMAMSLESLGHTVKRLNESDCSPDDVIRAAKECDLMIVEEGRLCGDHINEDGNKIIGLFQKVLNNVSCPVVSWITNLFYIGPRQVEIQTNPIFRAKVVFSTDGGHQKEFEAQGVNHILLRQGIHELEAYLGKADYPTKADVGFIGAIYDNIWPYRKKLVGFLKETYQDRFEHLGHTGDIRHDDLNRLLATLKVVVGDSVKSPYYWSNRAYEFLGRGAFMVWPVIEGFDQEYVPYKHYIPYQWGDWEGLKQIIDYYVDDKRKPFSDKMRVDAIEHSKKFHTYKHRVAKMLEILKEQKVI